MPAKENPMSIRSKNALAEALLKLMLKQPFNDISISDITNRAKLSRQTFYTNFVRKEDILCYLIDELFERYSHRITNICSDPSKLLVDYFYYWQEHEEFLSLLFRRDMGYIFQEKNRAFFRDNITFNNISNTDSCPASYIRASMAGLTFELMWLWLMSDEGLSIEALTALSDNILTGSIFQSKITS